MAKKSNRKDHITKKDSRSYESISNKLKANVLYLSYFISLFMPIDFKHLISYKDAKTLYNKDVNAKR